MWKNYRDLLIVPNLAAAQDIDEGYIQKNSREKRVEETFLTKQPKGPDEARLQAVGNQAGSNRTFFYFLISKIKRLRKTSHHHKYHISNILGLVSDWWMLNSGNIFKVFPVRLRQNCKRNAILLSPFFSPLSPTFSSHPPHQVLALILSILCLRALTHRSWIAGYLLWEQGKLAVRIN